MKNFLKKLKKVDGQSLAEFAVTTAMMATLATTAAPKFSGVGEGAKEKKTMADIDKILKAANNFYNTEVTESGRGRFPGQDKFDKNVPLTGGYGAEIVVDANGDSSYLAVDAELNLDLVGIPADSAGENAVSPRFNTYTSAKGSKWCSVFGKNNPDITAPDGNQISNEEQPVNYPGGTTYTITKNNGGEEFLDLFGGDGISSPFQDGHYIYTVIGGTGSGTQSIAPIVYVADLESPSSFFKKLQP